MATCQQGPGTGPGPEAGWVEVCATLCLAPGKSLGGVWGTLSTGTGVGDVGVSGAMALSAGPVQQGRAWAAGSVPAPEPRIPPAVTGCSGQRVLGFLPGGARALTSKSPVHRGRPLRGPRGFAEPCVCPEIERGKMINAATFLGKLLFGTQRHCCALRCRWTARFWSPGSQ